MSGAFARTENTAQTDVATSSRLKMGMKEKCVEEVRDEGKQMQPPL